MIAECKCQHCENPLEFEVTEFQETGRSERQIFGQSVPCPHCQKETIIYINKPEPPGGRPKEEPIQTTPAPTPEPPKKLIPDQKPDSTKSAPSFKRDWLALMLQSITAFAAIDCAVILFVGMHQSPAPVRWDYQSFEYDGKNILHSESSAENYYLSVVFADVVAVTTNGNQFAGLKLVEDRPRMVSSASSILNTIGSDGWELAWSDGEKFIVKRPSGKWRHEYFNVEYKQVTN